MIYDMLIIGGGPAGYSAAIYGARFMLKCVVVAELKGGLLTTTDSVENYPAITQDTGIGLMEKFEDHVKANEVEIKEDQVIDIKKEQYYIAQTKKGETIQARTVVIATGSEHRKLDIPGEKEFSAKGVSYCATCDAPLFKNRAVGIVGGSDSAVKEALLLSKYAKDVYIIYRGDKIRAEPINTKLAQEKENIHIVPNTNVIEAKGEQFLTEVVLDNPYNGSSTLQLDGLFIAIGFLPRVELAKQLGVKLNERNEIIADNHSKTNIEGVYAAGDVCDTQFKQAIISAAEGCYAAFSAYNYLEK